MDCVRESHRENGYTDLEDAIRKAIDYCIKNDILKDFLTERRMEVIKVMTLDYTYERRLVLQREEGREEGLEEGEKKGRIAGLMEGRISACKEFGLSYEATAAKVKELFSLNDKEVKENMRLYW